MAIRAMNLIGYPEEAMGFFHFVRDTIESRGRLDLMVAVDGADVPQEVLLTHLAGYGGSGPVRIGNAARDQLQLDIYGELMDSVYIYNKHCEPISHDLWTNLVRLTDWVCENWTLKDEGIWEIRLTSVFRVRRRRRSCPSLMWPCSAWRRR